MKYTHIIWDFNGTLFDDVEAGILSVNEMLGKRGLKVISSKEEYQEVFGFPIKEYYRRLGFDFEKEPYEVLAPIWVELYNKNSLKSELSLGAVEALEYFKYQGVKQVLLSATEREMLLGQVRSLGIEEYFCEIIGLDNIHAFSKEHLALEWCEKNYNAVPLVIGDTLHDLEVAKAMNVECILVSNGHHSKARLSSTGKIVCDDLYNVIELLSK